MTIAAIPMRCGALLSVAAVFLATVGADGLHPLCHHGHGDSELRLAAPGHTPSMASGPHVTHSACPVCVFQATSQLDVPALPAQRTELAPQRDRLVPVLDPCIDHTPAAPVRPRAP